MRVSATTEPSSGLSSNPRPAAAAAPHPESREREKEGGGRTNGRRASERPRERDRASEVEAGRGACQPSYNGDERRIGVARTIRTGHPYFPGFPTPYVSRPKMPFARVTNINFRIESFWSTPFSSFSQKKTTFEGQAFLLLSPHMQ